jgi:hypothetical protein
MFRVKRMSRGGWIVTGIVVGLLIVPSGVAVAKALAQTGIEGTNGTTTTLNEAGVTSAGQLLTTQATPNNYEDYTTDLAANGSSYECLNLAVIPSGKAFIVQQVEMNVIAADSIHSDSEGTSTSDDWDVFADTAAFGDCGLGSVITNGVAPGGTVGNVAVPIVPGYVVPSGYALDADATGFTGVVWVTGYLVPSSDSPSTPEVTHGKALSPLHRAS